MSGRCQLQKLEALLGSRRPVTRADSWQSIIDGLKAMNAAEKFIDDAIDKATGEKAFRTLQARVAMVGMQLVRSDARDGPVRLFLERQGVVHELRSVDDLEALLAHLGG